MSEAMKGNVKLTDAELGEVLRVRQGISQLLVGLVQRTGLVPTGVRVRYLPGEIAALGLHVWLELGRRGRSGCGEDLRLEEYKAGMKEELQGRGWLEALPDGPGRDVKSLFVGEESPRVVAPVGDLYEAIADGRQEEVSDRELAEYIDVLARLVDGVEVADGDWDLFLQRKRLKIARNLAELRRRMKEIGDLQAQVIEKQPGRTEVK